MVRWDALAGLGAAALMAAAAPAAAAQSTSQEIKQDARQAAGQAEQSAERAERKARQAARDADRAADKAGQKIDRAADTAGQKIDRTADKAGRRLEQAAEDNPRSGQGAAAATGQDADRTPRQRNDVSATANDAWLTAKTKLSLLADEAVGGMAINVDTENGVVTLKGEVKSRAEKQKAVELARQVEGVKDVRDQLVVKPESGTRAARREQPAGQSGAGQGRDDEQVAKDVRQAIQRQWRSGQLKLDGETLKGQQGTEIEVKVADGVVTLEGKVPDVQDILRAAQAARRVQGVRAVKTNVESGRPS